MTYQDCLRALKELGHELRGVKFTLDPITRILASLGHPEQQYPTAIIAGTNGKGSTSAMLARILEQAGYRTGLYTSPHLVRVNERMRVNGEEISDADFAAAFSEVWQCVERLREENAFAAPPSFFEYLTATAFRHFARAGVEFAVLEVGMGGRLDATNVTVPRVAVITNIELDHQQFLGSTHAVIAAEKAGVIKPGRPVISSVDHPEAAEVIRRRAAELGAPLFKTSRMARVTKTKSHAGRYAFDLELEGELYPNLKVPLAGRFQVTNAVTAVAAVRELMRQGFAISHEDLLRGLATARWPGRLETVRKHPLVVLDGAHNPAAAGEIAAYAREHWNGRRVRLVYASMRDKAISEISALLFPLAERIYLTQPDQERAAQPEEIRAAAGTLAAHAVVEPDPARALERAIRESAPEDIVLAAGSLFLVGALKAALAREPLQSAPRAARATVSPLP